MDYEKKLILFIDLLGFKKYIIDKTQDRRDNEFNIQRFINLIEAIRDDFCLDADTNLNQRIRSGLFADSIITQFSDSIILSTKYRVKSQLEAIMIDIINLICNGIYFGFIFRGALTYGNIIHNNRYLFGPGFIDAYEMESKRAIYPRVIIDHRLLEENGDYLESEMLKKILIKDDDNEYYLDMFSGLQYRYSTQGSIDIIIDLLSKIIDDGIKDSDQHIKEKYDWLKKKKMIYDRNPIKIDI